MNIPAPTTRREHLRHATAPAHARIDMLLSHGLAEFNQYAAYLRGMQRFIRESEQVLRDDVDAGAIVACRQHLDADLVELGLQALPPDSIGSRRAPLADVPAQLGWHYVVAGSALGARFLLRAAHALGLDARTGAAFLSHHATGGDWAAFLVRLEHATIGLDEYPRMCAMAGHAFEAAHAAMEAAQLETKA